MRLVKQFVVVTVVAFVGSLAIGAVQWNTPLTLALGVGTAVLALLAYRWIVRRTERRTPTEVARDGAAAGVGRGVLIGTGMFAAVIGFIAVLGGYEVLGWGSASGAVALFGFTAAAVVTEELIFRGILFRIAEGRLGTGLALALTGLLFGLAHLFNPHASLWSSIAIAIQAGGMLGAAYVATRTLWVPIGVHFGWNFGAAAIFGTDVSGTSAPEGVLNGATSGSVALSGGGFGPEASVAAVVAGLALTIAFLWLARRRGTLVARPRRGAPAATLVQ